MQTDAPHDDPMRELIRGATVETTTPARTRRVLILLGVMLFLIVAFTLIGSLLLGGIGNALVQLYYFVLKVLDNSVKP